MSKSHNLILEGLKRKKDDKSNESIIGTEVGLPIDKENCEATDASMVLTPDGKVGEKKLACPKCKSLDINIREDEHYHCTSCGYDWGNKLSDDALVDNVTGEKRDDKVIKEISSIFTKYAVSSKVSKTALRDFIYQTYGKKPGISNTWCIARVGTDHRTGDHRYEVEIGRNTYEVTEFEDIKKIYNEAYRMGNIIEGTLDEAAKYKVGKRYRTEDEMYFVVKKINKDGTINVYDEDVDKCYDVEVSDLELLHPVEIKN